MNNYKGTRAILIDDELKEAVPILQAASRAGIGLAYFNGSKAFPSNKSKLRGVRIAIVDMDLVGGATSEKSKAGATAGVISKVLASDNGPYVLLAWTKHPEILEHLKTYLFESSAPRPSSYVLLEKAHVKRADGSFDIAAISRELDAKLLYEDALNFFNGWEEKAQRYATEVTNLVYQLVQPDCKDPDEWISKQRAGVTSLLRSIAEAESGAGNLNREFLVPTLYRLLSPLHGDLVETDPGPAPTVEWFEKLRTAAASSVDAKARFNSRLHLAFGRWPFAAGNLYFEKESKTGELLKVIFGNSPPEDIKDKCIPVAVEVSPSCDHAQGKIVNSRLVEGLLVPHFGPEGFKKIKVTEYLWRLKPLYIPPARLKRRSMPVPTAETYTLVFNMLNLTTVKADIIKKRRSFARLRNQALVDIQGYLSRHAGRPGMATFS